MVSWRLSKYNPAQRDARGRYLRDDWTSVSDIGSTFDGQLLTPARYLETETAHVLSIQSFMREFRLEALGVIALDGPDGSLWEGPLTADALRPVQADLAARQEDLRQATGIPIIDFNICALDPMQLSGPALEAALRLILREIFMADLGVPTVLSVHMGYDYLLRVQAAHRCPAAVQRVHALGLFLEPSPEGLAD